MSSQLQLQIFQPVPDFLPLAIANNRRILRNNPGFWDYLNAVPFPAAILSLESRLILSNHEMLDWLDINQNEEPVGAPLADLETSLARSPWHPRTRQVEILGQAYFLLTLVPITNPDCDP